MGNDLTITNKNSLVGDGGAEPQEPRSRRMGFFHGLLRPRRIMSAMAVIAIASIALIAFLPADHTSARPTREGGDCGAPDGCHSGAETPSMMTVTGLPGGSFVPGQQYTITITMTDTNGATGDNAFDILATAGSFSTTDPNAEINAPTSGAEASTNDLGSLKATSWTVVWTAPLSGSAVINVWSVMGDGATGTLDIWDHENYSYSTVPEFTTIILPIAAIVGVLVLTLRMRKK